MSAPDRCWLECPSCGARRPIGPHFHGCERCVDPAGFPHWLEVRYDLERIARSRLVDLVRLGRVWEYDALLPGDGAAHSLGEGGTPLLRVDDLNATLGLPNLWLKWEGANPTGSFKDRLHTVTMAVGRALGFRHAVISTTGNAGVAAAAFAARNGLTLEAFVHPKTPPESVERMAALGATVVTADADAPARIAARVAAGSYPCTLLGTFDGPANPFGVEGYKTIAYESFAQLGRPPDRFCAPVSGGDALYGPYKGFVELRALGMTESIPRMTACRPAGETIALSIAEPTGSACVGAAIAGSAGCVWTVTEDEVRDALRLLARHGLLAEAASAVPIAALSGQARTGGIDPAETVVALVTASGKSVDRRFAQTLA